MAPTAPPVGGGLGPRLTAASRTRVLDESFPTMGTVARVVRDDDGGLDVRSLFAELERRLSRFDTGSDLSRLNSDPRAAVPAGSILRAAVGRRYVRLP